MKDFAYGSPEYKASLKELGPALEHHYKENKHHPEHWLNGIKVLEFEAWTPDWYDRKAKGKWKDAVGYGMAKKGYICLQDHGSEAWFKNIKIKKL